MTNQTNHNTCSGLDQWPESGELFGELENCRQLLDFKGDDEIKQIKCLQLHNHVVAGFN